MVSRVHFGSVVRSEQGQTRPKRAPGGGENFNKDVGFTIILQIGCVGSTVGGINVSAGDHCVTFMVTQGCG